MIEWACSSCDWSVRYAATATPLHYCPDCGDRTAPETDPTTLRDKETLTDKV